MHPTHRDSINVFFKEDIYKRASPSSDPNTHFWTLFSVFTFAFNPGKPFKHMDKEVDLDEMPLVKSIIHEDQQRSVVPLGQNGLDAS
jgi:hypothetical protein